jgi:hypothetical protein
MFTMEIGPVTLFVLGVAGTACLATRGPLNGAGDGGKDAARDVPVDTGPCAPPAGGNDLSFDLACGGGFCGVSTHLDFHVDPTSKSYPSCGDGNGNLELIGLTGADGAALSLDVTSYKGVGKYTLETVPQNDDLLFELQAMVLCAEAGDNTNDISLLIVNGVGELDAEIGEAGVPATCQVDVETDCMNPDGTHAVTGSLSCAFPNAGAGMECTLSNGKFTFGGCIP